MQQLVLPTARGGNPYDCAASVSLGPMVDQWLKIKVSRSTTGDKLTTWWRVPELPGDNMPDELVQLLRATNRNIKAALPDGIELPKLRVSSWDGSRVANLDMKF